MDFRPISSRTNPQFKTLRAVKPGFGSPVMLVEGLKLVGEALQRGLQPEALWCTEDPHLAVDCPVYLIPQSLYEQVSPTRNGQGPLAVFPAPPLPTVGTEGLAPGRYLLLDRIQDPGNAGALVRAAAAFGLSGVLWRKPCAYPFHHAAIRGSAGCCFALPHWLIEELPERMPPLIGAAGEAGAVSLESFKWPETFCLVLGNEGQGIDASIRSRLAQRVAIPMAPGVESLNVAGAAHILMYSISRSRP